MRLATSGTVSKLMSEFVGAMRFSNSVVETFSPLENGLRSSSQENCLTEAFNMLYTLLVSNV